MWPSLAWSQQVSSGVELMGNQIDIESHRCAIRTGAEAMREMNKLRVGTPGSTTTRYIENGRHGRGSTVIGRLLRCSCISRSAEGHGARAVRSKRHRFGGVLFHD